MLILLVNNLSVLLARPYLADRSHLRRDFAVIFRVLGIREHEYDR
jgi:hypothetical protein